MFLAARQGRHPTRAWSDGGASASVVSPGATSVSAARPAITRIELRSAECVMARDYLTYGHTFDVRSNDHVHA
jgi:hypothetical protein